jgi:hypothetical protein
MTDNIMAKEKLAKDRQNQLSVFCQFSFGHDIVCHLQFPFGHDIVCLLPVSLWP